MKFVEALYLTRPNTWVSSSQQAMVFPIELMFLKAVSRIIKLHKDGEFILKDMDILEI